MARYRLTLGIVVIAFSFLASPGCKSRKSDSAIIHPETPESTVEKIMVQYDTNRDGALDATELEQSPSLRTLLKSMGKRANETISNDELLQRIQAFQITKIRMPSVPCVVTLDGAPLADATITFTLESFHGSSNEAVTGKSGADGRADVQGTGGIVSGFYQIAVSKQAGGVELVPSKYNSATTLGVEVSSLGFGRGGTLTLDLSSQ